MNDTEMLNLQDTLADALHVFAGVKQALGHVTDVSNDYDMCQMLSTVMDTEIKKVFLAVPESWEQFVFVF